MKTLYTCATFILFCVSVFGQTQTASVPSPTPYAVVSRDANSRVWEQTTYELGPNEQVIPHVHHYTELATGLCYQQNGQWLDSQEQISILPDGSAAATNGQHQAYFPADIYDGEITLVTADGVQLQSRPVGLSYDDGTNTVLIAELTNSVGQLISSNQVIYTNAFVGIDADLLYTYRKSGFEQDVIFREQPPTPEQLGLNPDSTRLQLLTEFFNQPQPVETASPMNPQDGLQDTTLAFGSMQMAHGRAFLTGTKSLQSGSTHQIAVYKSWAVVDGRTLLIEEVPYQRINTQFSILPPPSATVGSVNSANALLDKITSQRLLPSHRLVKKTNEPMRLAKEDLTKQPGFMFDYVTMDSNETNFTFQGDTTYYVSADLMLDGTTTIEGGTAIKCDESGLLEINENGNVNCETSSYRPAVFTSANDNSIGETINGSSGSPELGDDVTFIQFDSTNAAIHDIRFCYSKLAIYQGEFPTYLEIWNSQFIDGDTAIYGWNFNLYNVLIGRNTNMDSALILEGTSLVAEHVTADGGSSFIEEDNNHSTSIALTNCLVTDQSLFGSGISGNTYILYTNSLACVPSPSTPIYQTVGGGSYYLTNASPYRQAGTSDIDSTLLADLTQKTTWPPVVYTNRNISSLGTLGLHAWRDTNASPDLGYHYDPLDYVFGGCDLHSNLTIAAGTGIGWVYERATNRFVVAIELYNGGNLSFDGTVTQPCFFSRHSMVQEDANGNWKDNTGSFLGAIEFVSSSTNGMPQLTCQFTKWTSDFVANPLNDNAYGAGTFKNCELYNAQISAYDLQSLVFTNCLFFRDFIAFWDQDYAISYAFENCTFYDGCLFSGRYNGQSGFYDLGLSSSFWLIENCSFDGTCFDWTDCLNANPTNTLFNYNSYNANNLDWTNYPFPYPPDYGTNEVVGPNDVVVTNYNWQTRWFGNFYLPTNSLLIRAGFTNANVLGLYHFTTLTNQIPEGTNIVDIGYHYVAADSDGNPLDSNGDGIPDYLEDPLGNGLPYDGTNWALAINVQPTNQIVIQGSNVTMSVTAGGVPSLIYQWYFNSAAVTSATNTTLTFDNVLTNNAGSYYVIVTNGFGAVTSSVATLTVLAPPSVSITNPINNTIISYQTNINLMAVASDFAGIVTQVQFLENGMSLGFVTNEPYNLVWTNAPFGGYALTAIAIDNYGLSSTSAVVNFTVGRPSVAAIGGERIMELTGNGDVVSWGGNQDGEFGDYTYLDGDAPLLQSNVPVHVVGLTNITAIASGLNHSLALDANGFVWGWGEDSVSQLGNDEYYTSTNLPERVIGVTNVVSLAASGYINEDGEWGFSLAVESNGTVWTWGETDGDFGNSTPQQITSISNAVSVAAGDTYALILENDGSVWSWDGYSLSKDSGLSNIVAVCASYSQYGYDDNTYLALDSHGSIWAGGPNKVGGISNVVAIAAGASHYLALDSKGQLWAWGDDSKGQLGDGGAIGSTSSPMSVGGMTNIVTIAAGLDASVVVDASNRLWQFGSSDGDDVAWPWGATNGLPRLSPQYEDFYKGQSPVLTILSGNNQSRDGGLEFLQPLVFQVTDTNGVALSNAPVSVQVITGDMALRTVSGGTNYQGLRLMTDVNGKVSLIGYADQYVGSSNCLIRVLAASRQQLREADFSETLVSPPTISITSPGNGTACLVDTNQPLTISVNAQPGPGGSISAVDYYYGTNGSANMPLGISTGSPFSFTWTNASWWSNAFYAQYTVSAVAVDAGGATSAAPSVTFSVALDSAGDGLPDYWQIEYFGTNGLNPNSSPDGNGQSLLYDYTNGINPTDYYDGKVPTLEILSGNDQSGGHGAFLPFPLVVQVTDSSGNILTNAPLTIDVTKGAALLATVTNDTPTGFSSLRTDSNGVASTWIYFPPASSNTPDSTILISACSTTNCADITANEFVPMAHWTFNNTNTWVGVEGQLPLIATNVVGVPDWSSNAVQIDSVSPSFISYNVVETNGSTNINCRIGSVLFWFKPDWSSTNAGGNGPGEWGRLIEMGHYSPTFTNGWWSLYLSPDGTQLLFGTSTNGLGMTNLSATISWNSNEWYQIALTYSPTGSAAYVDGQLSAAGNGVTYFPDAADLTNGFRIGSDQFGTNQAAGTFDELQTFDYPLNTNNTATFDSALPVWWELENFNSNQLNPSATFGNSRDLLYDYTNGLNPNVISFTLANTNRYFNSSTVTIPVLVTGGIPFYEAVLVNDTNALIGDFSDAIWEPCTSSNITVNLGPSNGLYSVWIGLSGLPEGATPTWLGTQLIMVTNAPVFVITNPTSGTVTQPMVQLQGWVSETLSKLSYDVSNALGVVTNQPGQWAPFFFNTNVLDFTTNFFQCYDIPLTNGLNVITLHAMDLAGNGSTTNINLMLDYSGLTAPNLGVLWPTNGTSISGTNFTLQGLLDDDTATVSAQIVNTNGDTNKIQAVVERSGTVWLQNLPLAEGTNILTITATNAAGLSQTTNVTLVQSQVFVTMKPLNQFNQSPVSVTGTISDPTCTLTVNGVAAYYLDTNGDWEADNVQVSPTGTATFNIQIFNNDSELIGSQSFSQPQPPMVGLESYSGNNYIQRVLETGPIDGFASTVTITDPNGDTETITYPTNITIGINEISGAENWNYLSGGTESSYGDLTPAYSDLFSELYSNDYPPPYANSSSTSIPAGLGAFSAGWEYLSYASAYYNLKYIDFLPFASFGNTSYGGNARVMIEPSGQEQIGQKVIYQVQAQVTGTAGSPTPPINKIQIQGQKLTIVTNTDGSVWGQILLYEPAGAYVDVTPQGPAGNFVFNVTVQDPTLQIIDNNTGYVLTGQTNTIIVGQQMNLIAQLSETNSQLNNSMLTNFQWTVPGYAISNYVIAPDTNSATVVTNFPTTNSGAIFYWVDGATNRIVQCTAMVSGLTISNQAVFNVLRPTANINVFTNGPVVIDNNDPDQEGTSLHWGVAPIYLYPATNYGISFWATNFALNGCPSNSQFLFVQVGTNQAEHNLTNGTSYRFIATGLDLEYPCDSFLADFAGIPVPYYDDQPAEPANVSADVWRSDHFTAYLLFEPPYSNSIPVPLKLAQWSWSGVGQTNGAGGWNLVSSSTAIYNVNVNAGYPTWSGIQQNGTNYIYSNSWIEPFP